MTSQNQHEELRVLMVYPNYTREDVHKKYHLYHRKHRNIKNVKQVTKRRSINK